ncbi:protein kinase domain-containing protein [Sorangium sp. So ce1182]|uniref:serine/threonine-protein kinase n=1 Tax=Sorangium sp. So ce1182 TaxID=3133334 RepID=UPI003F5DFBD2
MSAPVAEGQILSGKYRVERILGQGGMGVVVAALHEQLHQRVAIKLLHPGANAEMVERFVREARAAVRLKSEHVARVLDVGTLETGAPFMVMEYLEGSDLQQTLRERGPLELEEAVGYVLEACEAIAEAHAAGIIHRDLKPANLFLARGADGSGMVKVLDFGISKALAESSSAGGEPELGLTKTAMVLGSPLYMAPEQMRSARTVDTRADIWSLGAILYQLLTARVPFDATSLSELILMINTEVPPSPSTFRSDLPPGLEAAILRCLEKDVAKRFRSVAELAVAIVDFGPPLALASLERIERTLGLVPAVAWRDRASAARERMSVAPWATAQERASSVPAATAQVRPSSMPPADGAGGRTAGVAAVHTASAAVGHTAGPAATAPGWAAGGSVSPGRKRTGLVLALAGVGVAAVLGGVLRVVTFHGGTGDPAVAPSATAAIPSAEPPAPVAAPLPPPVATEVTATASAATATPPASAAPSASAAASASASASATASASAARVPATARPRASAAPSARSTGASSSAAPTTTAASQGTANPSAFDRLNERGKIQ